MSIANALSKNEGDIHTSAKTLVGLKVIAAEDEPMLLMTLEDMLTDLGCQLVATAATVPDALAMVSATEFDAAILDVTLGRDQIDSVADALAQRRIPAVIATGHGARAVARYSETGFTVIEKPYTADALAKALLASLARAHA
ncbi:MAG: response regulator [Hyphomicrobium sp.]